MKHKRRWVSEVKLAKDKNLYASFLRNLWLIVECAEKAKWNPPSCRFLQSTKDFQMSAGNSLLTILTGEVLNSWSVQNIGQRECGSVKARFLRMLCKLTVSTKPCHERLVTRWQDLIWGSSTSWKSLYNQQLNDFYKHNLNKLQTFAWQRELYTRQRNRNNYNCCQAFS